MSDNKKFSDIESLAIRAGHRRSAESEHAEPIFPTSSFVFDSAEQARARFANEEDGNVYSRFSNPTVRTFQERLAAMEGGESCVATSSGMAAILATCMALLKSGDHVLCSNSVFGSTMILLDNYFVKFGVEVEYVEVDNPDAWAAAVKANSKMFFLETPSNPLTTVADVSAISAIAKQHECVMVVDNCFCTPILQRPLEQGADLVIHSATKYLDGQGRCVGGAVVGPKEIVDDKILTCMRSAGEAMSPLNAWVFLKGLETSNIRMQAHCQAAHELAVWLEGLPKIDRVYYPGLESHPQHKLAASQQSGFGGIVSFEVTGGREAAWRVIDATEMLSITANLGDVKTTITHPATTTHGRLNDEQRVAAGINEGLIRVAVGLESLADIKKDLQRGL